MNTVDHSSRAHAVLSASSAYRWMTCTPSAVLESMEPEKTSPYAAEGTLAHEIAEVYLRYVLSDLDHEIAKESQPLYVKPEIAAVIDVDLQQEALSQLVALKQREGYSTEMDQHAKDYATYVLEQIDTPDALVDVEACLDFSKYVPEGFGTGDCVIAQDGVLTIIDYKYGQGVKVHARQNPQMMLYALGAIEVYDCVCDFTSVKMAIFQPRLGHISEWVISRAELEAWAEETLKPKAAIAAKGEGAFTAGDHCRFCAYAAKCNTLAAYCLAVASKEFEDETGALSTEVLTAVDWNMILSRIDIVESWIGKVKEAALEKLMANPESIPGYKVVEGRSVRKYSDADAVAKRLAEAGISEDVMYKPRELVGITEMTKRLGKARATELLDGMITKPAGKPTVVPSTDKRPAINTTAEADFKEE